MTQRRGGGGIGRLPNAQRHQWSRYRARVLPELWERQGGVCAACGGAVDLGVDGRRPDGASVDHVLPLHDGGQLIPDSTSGVRLVHTRCNAARANRTRRQSIRRGWTRDEPRISAAENLNGRLGDATIDDELGVFSERDLTPPQSRIPDESPQTPPDTYDLTGDPVRLPRIYTETPRDVTGSYGSHAVEWARTALDVECRPWQSWTLQRALEHRADGSLRWPVVVLSVSRQSGKSIIGRIVCGWRYDAGAELFGESQIVVNTANKYTTAQECWQAAAYMLQRNRGARVRWARGDQEMGDPLGSRWLVQAATANLGVGLSVSLGLVDEAWNVERDCVEAALVPTMLERASPQLWIVSTQGDSSSDLLETYRRQGVDGSADPDSADVLLLEWSSDPSALVTDRDAWRAASPHWTAQRERFIERQLAAQPDQTFRTQYLNQRVDALGGWVTRSQWAGCHSPQLELQAGPDAPRLIAACEYSEDGALYALVVTQLAAGRIIVRRYGERSIDGLWRRIAELPQSALLLVSVGFRGRLPLARCETRMVGVNELRLATRVALRAITDGVVAHDGDADLSRHVLTAVVAYTGETGPVLSQRRSPGQITYARALTWCIGATLEVAEERPRPRVYSAQ